MLQELSRSDFPLNRRWIIQAWTFGCVTLSLAASGCTGSSSASAAPAMNSVSDSSVLATVAGEEITMADIRGRASERMDQLEGQYLRARDKIVGTTLDSLVRERIIAAEVKKTGKSPDDLLIAEAGGNFTPSDVEVSAWYSDNRARLGGRSLDQVRSQISDYLIKERRAEAEKKLIERLRKESAVTIAYEPYRLRFANEGAPTLGRKDAPVTLVEFSDFQCPYCRSVAPSLKQVAAKFGNDVQIIYRQYPITSIHPNAWKAAEASLCANDQGKFWEFHDELFSDQQKLAISDLKEKAKKLGLDAKKFNGCLDSGKFLEQVQNDEAEAKRIGANGTPSMYINGIYVEGGSVPYSTLEDLIQKELERVKKKS